MHTWVFKENGKNIRFYTLGTPTYILVNNIFPFTALMLILVLDIVMLKYMGIYEIW